MTKKGNKRKEKGGVLPVILDVWSCSGDLYPAANLCPGVVGGLWCSRVPCQELFTCWLTCADGASGQEGKNGCTKG